MNNPSQEYSMSTKKMTHGVFAGNYLIRPFDSDLKAYEFASGSPRLTVKPIVWVKDDSYLAGGCFVARKKVEVSLVLGYTEEVKCDYCEKGMESTSLIIVKKDQQQKTVCYDCLEQFLP